MDRFRFFGKTYKDKYGVTRIKYKNSGAVSDRIYYDLKSFSNACEYASSNNFNEEIMLASRGLSSVILYQDYYYHRMISEGETDFAMAKLFIICRFSNSIYAAIRLACMGLILDGIGCLKTAFEGLQYSRLISLDPSVATIYLDPDEPLRPVEVRKRLEKLEHDVDSAKERYSTLSKYAHIGGIGESLVLEHIDDDVSFRIGGYVDPELQSGIVRDCYRATGELIAFSAGVRQENVEKYHQTIREWYTEGLSPEEIMRRIPNLVEACS